MEKKVQTTDRIIPNAFEHEMFGTLRVAVTDDQKTLFNLADVCRALTLSTPGKVKRRLSERGMNSIHTPTLNQFGATVMQAMTYIDEANLYRCIFQSRKAEAEKFQDWVFEEVLPQIRQTGGYIPTRNKRTGERLSDEEIVRLAHEIIGRTLALKNVANECCQTATEVAMAWGINVLQLNGLLQAVGIIERRGGRWHLAQSLEGQGLAEDRHFFCYSLKGRPRSVSYLVWTPEGVQFLERRVRWLADSLPAEPRQLNLFINNFLIA